MKILCIGNSFSQDATRYLEAVSNHEIMARNCFIGGCSLEEHCRQIAGGQPSYEYQKDAESLRMISLSQAIQEEAWDIITLQQVSCLAGIASSYEPWLGRILEFVRARRPNAEILLHQTWAYDDGSNHPGFSNYHYSQDDMFYAVCSTVAAMASAYDLRVIPTGEAVQRARSIPAFDMAHGGAPLTRDGYHLSLDYGRYLAALVWYHSLTGHELDSVCFAPEGTVPEKIAQLRYAVVSLPC